MSSMDSAVAIAGQIKSGAVSACECLEAQLVHIERTNVRLNAVVQLDIDGAWQQAAAADQAVANGDTVGPLHGVAVTLKDSIDTAGMITTVGTLGRKAYVPAADATVAARLRAAGAIILGKTNTPEMTLGGECYNLVYGQTDHPTHPGYSPGSSSGGSAASVASGMSLFELGSDTGGSIREPSHYCGVVGIKPTAGRVPRTGHGIPFGIGAADFLTQIGPIARSVDDLELILGIISGPDGIDPLIAPAPLGVSAEVDISQLRVAFFTHTTMGPLDPAVEQAVRRSAECLAEVGASVVEQVPSVIEQAPDLYTQIAFNGRAAYLHRLLEQYGTQKINHHLARMLKTAAQTTMPPLSETLLALGRYQADMLRFMAAYDVILCAVEPWCALPQGKSQQLSAEEARGWGYMSAFNLTGWPCGSVPMGMNAEQLPVGVQVVSRAWREDIVLAVMRWLHQWLEA